MAKSKKRAYPLRTGIRIYWPNGTKEVFNHGTGMMWLRLWDWRAIVAIGTEEGAMVVHYGPRGGDAGRQ